MLTVRLAVAVAMAAVAGVGSAAASSVTPRSIAANTAMCAGAAPVAPVNGRIVVQSRTGGLSTINSDGRGLRRLTTGVSDQMPAVSADGRGVAFIGRGGGKVVDIATRAVRTVLPMEEMVDDEASEPPVVSIMPVAPAWSADGQWIAFTVYLSDERRSVLRLARADGSGFRDVAAPDGTPLVQASFSPNGRCLMGHPADHRSHLAIMAAEGGVIETVNAPSRTFGPTGFWWSRDGGRVITEADTQTLRTPRYLYSFALDGTKVSRIAKLPPRSLWSTLSPDRRWVAYNRVQRGGRLELFVRRIGSSTARRLSRNMKLASSQSWGPRP